MVVWTDQRSFEEKQREKMLKLQCVNKEESDNACSLCLKMEEG